MYTGSPNIRTLYIYITVMCLINESLMNDKNLEESNRVADLYGRPLGLGVRVSINIF